MLIKIAIALSIFLLIFQYSTRYYVNPYKLYLVFGKKGSGKSTYLVKLAYKHLKKGWIVYTNMDEMHMPGVRHINVKHLGDFVPEQNSLLLLDEVGMIWDNRDYKFFKTSVRDFFKLQRHYHVKVYMASQTFDVDKKLRDLCDGMFLHTNRMRVFTLGKRIVRKIVIVEATAEAESRISENLAICPPWEWTLTYIPRWSKYFDSHSLPPHEFIEYREDVDSEGSVFLSASSTPSARVLRLLRRSKFANLPYSLDVDSSVDIPSVGSRSFERFRCGLRFKGNAMKTRS